MELNLHLLIQRAVELLVFYLILANINGQDLKASLIRLVKTKQKTFYGNMVLLAVYPIAMMLLIQHMINYDLETEGYLIDQLLHPLAATYLLRLALDVKKLLVAHLFKMLFGTVIIMIGFVLGLNTTVVFLLILAAVLFMNQQNYFESIYVRLIKKRWLLNLALVLSFMFYLPPYLVESSVILLTIALIICSLSVVAYLGVAFYFKKESDTFIERIQNAKNEELFDVLETLSAEHQRSHVAHAYTIKHYNLWEILSPLLKQLDTIKRREIIRDFDYVLTKRKVKIHIIL